MPELPEVEGFRVAIDTHLAGRTINRVRTVDDLLLREVSVAAFRRRLTGRRVSSVSRHGKHVLVFTDARGPVLALHFGMTGRPVVDSDEVSAWDRLVLELDRGPPLRYRNKRRLGAIRLLDRDGVFDLLWRLGPDALEAPRDWFVDALRQRRAPVKAVLLDQAFLAGVGNIYADEALLAAGVRPSRRAGRLRADEAATLHRELGRVLRRAVRAHRAGRDARFPLMDVRHEASRNLAAYGDPAVGCPRCGRPLRTSRIGGRTSFWCASCQR